MTQEELIKLINEKEITIDAKDPTKEYLISVQVGDMPKEEVVEFLKRVKEVFESRGFNDAIYLPVYNNEGQVEVNELKDINKPKYMYRKKFQYDDDMCVLFYKGNKVANALWETFSDNWSEEVNYFNNMNDFLEDVASEIVELDEEDVNDNWDNIWYSLAWDNKSKSYKYKNWELIILDI